MSQRPPYEPPPPLPPMSARTGDRVVIALGVATTFIGVVTMAVERATDLTLSHAIGLPIFMSTPLGIAALAFIPIVWRVSKTHGLRQVALAAIFWSLWIFWSLT